MPELAVHPLGTGLSNLDALWPAIAICIRHDDVQAMNRRCRGINIWGITVVERQPKYLADITGTYFQFHRCIQDLG